MRGDLGVVRRDDQDVAPADDPRLALARPPTADRAARRRCAATTSTSSVDVVDVALVLDRQPADAGARTAGRRRPRAAAASMPTGPKSPVVEHLGRERHRCPDAAARCPLEEQAQVGRGWSGRSPSRCWSADASAPGGWLPGWAAPAAAGHPAAPSTRPPRAMARVLASAIWPASSTNSTSTESASVVLAQSHAVPPATSTAPVARASRESWRRLS